MEIKNNLEAKAYINAVKQCGKSEVSRAIAEFIIYLRECEAITTAGIIIAANNIFLIESEFSRNCNHKWSSWAMGDVGEPLYYRRCNKCNSRQETTEKMTNFEKEYYEKNNRFCNVPSIEEIEFDDIIIRS